MSETTTPPACITEAHLRWAASQGCAIVAGTCGFGRDCVGLLMDNHWVDYSSFDWRADSLEDGRIENSYRGFIPPDAYHKDDCVAVLVRPSIHDASDDDEMAMDTAAYGRAWGQLAEWLDAIIEGGWVVRRIEHTPKHALDLLMHGSSTPRLVKP